MWNNNRIKSNTRCHPWNVEIKLKKKIYCDCWEQRNLRETLLRTTLSNIKQKFQNFHMICSSVYLDDINVFFCLKKLFMLYVITLSHMVPQYQACTWKHNDFEKEKNQIFLIFSRTEKGDWKIIFMRENKAT